MSTIGGRIQYARIAAGLTQEQLASKVGVSKGAVSQWESGTIKTLSAESLLKLADAVEASERWIMLGKDDQGHDIPMGKPTHLDPDASDLIETYIQLPEHAREELRSDAHKYLRISAPQQATKANPYPRPPRPVKKR